MDMVRNLERAGVPRSIAMKITGHKTEAVDRRHAIVNEADVAEGLERLAGVSVRRITSNRVETRSKPCQNDFIFCRNSCPPPEGFGT